MLRRPRYFEPPSARVFTDGDGEYLPGFATYTSYNYLGGGPVARVKAAHFEAALELTRDLHGSCDAVDFGCADGVLLPSLARLFNRVYAVDVRQSMVAVANQVKDELGLANVEVVCNEDRDFASLAEDTASGDFRVAFLLETLEHIGEAETMWRDKVEFVEGVLGLLAPGGRLVISVPTMVGLPFLAQRAALAAGRMHREPINARDLFNAVVRRNTDALEPRWTSEDHLGFNHRKLERHLRERFRIAEHRNLGFSQVYVVTAR